MKTASFSRRKITWFGRFYENHPGRWFYYRKHHFHSIEIVAHISCSCHETKRFFVFQIKLISNSFSKRERKSNCMSKDWSHNRNGKKMEMKIVVWKIDKDLRSCEFCCRISVFHSGSGIHLYFSLVLKFILVASETFLAKHAIDLFLQYSRNTPVKVSVVSNHKRKFFSRNLMLGLLRIHLLKWIFPNDLKLDLNERENKVGFRTIEKSRWN